MHVACVRACVPTCVPTYVRMCVSDFVTNNTFHHSLMNTFHVHSNLSFVNTQLIIEKWCIVQVVY